MVVRLQVSDFLTDVFVLTISLRNLATYRLKSGFETEWQRLSHGGELAEKMGLKQAEKVRPDESHLPLKLDKRMLDYQVRHPSHWALTTVYDCVSLATESPSH